MASNYFGFSAAVTQYGAQTTPAYPAAPAYAVAQPAPQTYSAAPAIPSVAPAGVPGTAAGQAPARPIVTASYDTYATYPTYATTARPTGAGVQQQAPAAAAAPSVPPVSQPYVNSDYAYRAAAAAAAAVPVVGHSGHAGAPPHNQAAAQAVAQQQPQAPPPPVPPSYDGKTSYYQQAPPHAALYSTDTSGGHYSGASSSKPGYSQTGYSMAAGNSGIGKTPMTMSQSTSTYMYPGTGGSSSSYEAAVYNAATSMMQQQQVVKSGGWTNYKSKNQYHTHRRGGGMGGGGPGRHMPPKSRQLHYCEICKISCAGPQTYKEHLEGQKHKKKEAQAKITSSVGPPRAGQNQLRCELCDITCTGADAYQAHIRGVKHQKVIKLHQELGKPIPSTEPIQVKGGESGSSSSAKTAASTTARGSKVQAMKKVTAKINFVSSSTLKTLAGGQMAEQKNESSTGTASSCSSSTSSAVGAADKKNGGQSGEQQSQHTSLQELLNESDVQPVGQDYIEEVRSEETKQVNFYCKLCDCRFNDPNAKEMHMKGRRHRLQYKKKVDPDLIVEIKPSIKARKGQEVKLRNQMYGQDDHWRRMYSMEEMQHPGPGWGGGGGYPGGLPAHPPHRMGFPHGFPHPPRMGMGHMRGPMHPPPHFAMGMMPGRGPGGPAAGTKRPDTQEDRHTMAKHSQVYPTDEELQAVQGIVSNIEKALKQVSDYIAEVDNPPSASDTASSKKTATANAKDGKESDTASDSGKEAAGGGSGSNTPARALKGVMRVGVLAKGLLLRGDLNVQLVLLCHDKPTRTLLERVADNIPKQLTQEVSDDQYELQLCVEEAAIKLKTKTQPEVNLTITLTSPAMRDTSVSAGDTGAEPAKVEPPDVLDGQKCLDALATLRHAKWFQARANGLTTCVIVIRILRDLCSRVPTWAPMNGWGIELLVEQAIRSSPTPLSPGDTLRRVFEAISAGILLPGSPGLMDPCEKEPTDATSHLTSQEREDITASGQHALRLIAFRQIHKVLGMEQLPPAAVRYRGGAGGGNRQNRKRPYGDAQKTDDKGDGKKDKKDGEGGGGEDGAGGSNEKLQATASGTSTGQTGAETKN